jgi:hypothetical protein
MDTFCYLHHAISALVITATDRILEATCCLTNAIDGVQEVPPDEIAAIQSLQALLLGKETPQEPELSPQPCKPNAPLTVSSLAKLEHDNPPIRMWNPRTNETLAIHKSCPTTRLPTSPAPAVTENVMDKFDKPPIPIVMKIPARGHYARPPQAQPISMSQLRVRTMYMINSAVSDALMPMLVTAATMNTPLVIG